MDSAKQFLSYFPGNEIYVSSSDVEIPQDDPDHKLKSNPWHIADSFDNAIHKLQRAQGERRGIFFTVNELDQSLDPGRKRTKKMFVRARAVWVEDDAKRDQHRTDWPIQPNIVVNSSPGKYHYYWLTSTTNPTEWDNVMKRMVQDYGCDNQAKDLARVLRIPGFYHHKREPAHMVTFIVNREKPYDWEAIKVAFPPIEGEVVIPSTGSSTGVMPGMSIAELYDQAKEGHQHGPSRAMAMKLANYGMPKPEALAIMLATLPEHHPGHHEQSLDTAYAKIAAEQAAANSEHEIIELPEIQDEFNYSIEFPPGLMGQLAQECYEMAFYPNRKVAIITAMGMIAGIVGRSFNVSRMGLNVYIAVMMDTGTGKDIINKIINSTLYGLPLTSGKTFVGDSGFTGAKAFRQNLEEGRSKISVITEAGLFGKSQSGDKDTLRRDMLDAFTKSGKDSYLGALRYSAKENSLAAIRAPAFSIIFESTQKSFIDSLKHSEAKISGELARMWILRIKDQVPYPNKNVRRKFSDDITKRISALVSVAGKLQLPEHDNDLESKVTELKYSDRIGYEQMCKFVDMRNEAEPDSLRAVMLSRAWEKAIRIAAIVSVFNGGPGTKEVSEEAFDWTMANVIMPELESVEMMFKEGASDDIMDVIRAVVAPTIQRMLIGKFKDAKKKPPADLARYGMFTRSNLHQWLRNNQVIASLNSSQNGSTVKHGFDKVLSYMIEHGYLVHPSVAEITIAGGNAKIKPELTFKITEELKTLMEM